MGSRQGVQAVVSAKNYEYISDGYSARFLDPKTGKTPRYGNYVTRADYDMLRADIERSTAQYNSIIDRQLNVIQGMQAEIDRLNEAIIRGAIIPDAKPE